MKRIKRRSFQYIYMLLMFMWAARATPVFDNLGFLQTPLSFVTFLLLNGYVFKMVYKWDTFKRIVPLMVIVLLWYICSTIKYRGGQPLPWTIFYSMIIAYNGIYLFGERLFDYFEKVLVDLCVVSLVVWGLAVLFPNIVPLIVSKCSLPVSNEITESHLGLVGLSHTSDVFFVRRNLGFTWEPGRFACFILLGMLFNLMRTHCNLKFSYNNNFYVLFITLLSTGSTTGYAAFFLIFLYILINKGYASRFLITLLGFLIIPSVLALPFMQEKILNAFSLDREIEIINYFAQQDTRTSVWVPQRGVGLYFDFLNFIHDPLLGYGSLQNSFITKTYKGFEIALSNGLIQIFSTFGLFVGLYFYILCYKSSSLISRSFRVPGRMFFFILFCLINISYNFWLQSLLMMFVFYCVFVTKKQL